MRRVILLSILTCTACSNVDEGLTSIKQPLLNTKLLADELVDVANSQCGESEIKIRLSFENKAKFNERNYSIEFNEDLFYLNDSVVSRESLDNFLQKKSFRT